MPKSKKSNSISQDYIIDLINQEYSELEKHLRNVLKNDNVTFNARRKWRAISNNLSIVKKRIRWVQAKLNEDFNLPQQKDTAPIKQETNNVSPREKLMSALKWSEMDDDISTFFAERIKTFLTFWLESFYERIGKQVFHEKIAEENLIFIQRIFQYLYENIEEKVINIDNENLNFEKIKTTLKNTEQFKIYFNENKGKFCWENKEKQKILDIFIQEIISWIALIDSCASLNDFLEQTLNEDRIPNRGSIKTYFDNTKKTENTRTSKIKS